MLSQKVIRSWLMMLKRQILVEGPDCSGKTTLVERLKNELQWDAKSLHHLEGNQFTRYLREYALQERIVFNRGHYSEVAYGKLWRNGNPFSEPEKNILDQLSQQNMIIIFTCPSLEILQQRYQERDFQQQIKFEELAAIRRNFCELFQNIPHLLYQSTSYEELSSFIEKVVRQV